MYDLPEQEMRGFTIGQRKEEKIPMGPGPGQYEHRDLVGKDAPGATIRGRPEERVPEDKPGPGFYEMPEQQQKGFTIGQKKEEKIPLGPGPGQYEHRDLVGKDAPGATIRGRPEERLPEQMPGPGMYELPPEESKGFTIGQKKEEKIPVGPGPG